MKKLIRKLMAIAAILLFVQAAQANITGIFVERKFHALQDTVKQINIVRYEVYGMDCPGCQSALEKQVEKIDGVANAKASWKDKEVVVTLKPGAQVKEEEIIERIKKANFTPGKKTEPGSDEKK